MSCPPPERLLDLVRGVREAGDATATAPHVETCRACRELRDLLGAVAQAAAAGALPQPPEVVLSRALDLFQPRAAPAAGASSGWSLLQLVRSAWSGPLAAGVRGASAPARERLLFSEGDADLDLEVVPLDEEDAEAAPPLRVTGQLLLRGLPPPEDVIAALWSRGAVSARAQGDRTGTFTFPRVTPGAYALTLWLPSADRGLRLDPLRLPPEGP